MNIINNLIKSKSFIIKYGAILIIIIKGVQLIIDEIEKNTSTDNTTPNV